MWESTGASGGFSPETLEVAVAKESNKVIMIKPHTLKDKFVGRVERPL